MKRLALIAVVLGLASGASALDKTPDYYLGHVWNNGFYFPYLDKISKVKDDKVRDRSCDNLYSNVLRKGEIHVIVGLGYYDSSEGGDLKFRYNDENGRGRDGVIGVNDTIDIAYKAMYTELFTRHCKHNLRLCEMKETSDGVFEKDVESPTGQRVHVLLEMKNSSVTRDHQTNVGSLLAQQTAKSNATTKWFFESIPNADVIVYNGHSRRGGGPDFNPPKLYKNLHVNYPWYEQHTPGFNYLLEALSQPTKPSVLLLMSCNSDKLFEPKIRSEAPNTAFSGSKEVIHGNIATEGMLGGIDSFLRFQCQSGYNNEMNVTDELKQMITPIKIPVHN